MRMTVRKVARREVRLDTEHDRQLEEALCRRGLTFAAWVREQIDREADEKARASRLAALEELFKEQIDWGYDEAEDQDDPATELINKAYDEELKAAGLNE